MLRSRAAFKEFAFPSRHRLSTCEPRRPRFLCASIPAALCAAVLLLYSPYLTSGLRSANDVRDGHAYQVVVADALAQCRAGAFPVYVGQSAWRYNGGTYPQAQAPLLTTAACALDYVTTRRLPAAAVLNTLLVIAALTAAVGMYRTLLEVGRGQAVAAGLLALAFVACPGVLGLLFRLDMVMSLLAVAFLPWVWLALWRIWGGGGWRASLLLGSSFALLLMAHPPIALWTGVAAAAASVAAPVSLRRGARALALSVAFTSLAACWPLTVVFMLGNSAGVGATGQFGHRIRPKLADFIAGIARAEVPGSLLPVGWARTERANDMPARGPGFLQGWGSGAFTPYLQLGYALWAALLFGVWWTWRTGDRRLASLLAGSASLCIFLFPLPGVTTWLWRMLPSFFDVTRWWAAERLYPILASLAAVTGAAAWAGWREAASRRARRRLAAFAAMMAVWLAHEAMKFTTFGLSRPVDRAVERVENTALRPWDLQASATRPMPVYSDPALHQRVLGESAVPYLDNAAALSLRCARAQPLATDGALPVPLVLQPGHRLVVCVSADRVATLWAFGPGFLRAAPATAGQIAMLPLWTSGSSPQEIELKLSDADSGKPLPWPRDTLRSAEYAWGELPVRVRSLLPYRVKVNVRDPGLRLETSRLCVPGYAARVNGGEARLGCSDGGYVTVALVPGRNEVELQYDPPAAVRWAFGVTLATLAAGVLVALRGRLSAPAS